MQLLQFSIHKLCAAVVKHIMLFARAGCASTPGQCPERGTGAEAAAGCHNPKQQQSGAICVKARACSLPSNLLAKCP